jgi:hypothetical protein
MARWTRGVWALGGATVLALLAGGVGCGAAPDGPRMEPGRPIPGLNLTGKWYSREFGDMKVTHEKGQVRGKYEDPRGPDHNGTLRGTINNDLIEIEWIKQGNPLAAVMPMRGKARLRILDRGCKLDGLWGYDEDWHGGGVWQADKSQFAAGGEHCGDSAGTRPSLAPAPLPIDGTTEEQLREQEGGVR